MLRDLLKVKTDILANGRVEGHEIDRLREALYADGNIDRQAADVLVELHKQVQRRSPAFEQFYYRALKDHILQDGKVTAEESGWLRQALLRDDQVSDLERKFLHELRGEARDASPEFERLCEECLSK